MQQTSTFIRSFVRREGRFTKAQRVALQQHWPHYGIDIKQDYAQLKLDTLFVKQQPIVLDVGFGNGESLLYLAQQHPNLNFLGVEVYRPGIGNLLRNAFNAKLENIRIANIDVVELLQKHIAVDCFFQLPVVEICLPHQLTRGDPRCTGTISVVLYRLV